jgi:hypothetical protein
MYIFAHFQQMSLGRNIRALPGIALSGGAA